MSTTNSPEDLQKEWRVLPCSCRFKDCSGAFIEPDIVGIQGSISISSAEHIVELHNAWLKEKQEVDSSREKKGHEEPETDYTEWEKAYPNI